MFEFLVEAYVSRDSVHEEPPFLDEISSAVIAMSRQGTPVRFLRSIFVPRDETCFYLFQASSIEVVREAAQRAGVRVERISEATSAG